MAFLYHLRVSFLLSFSWSCWNPTIVQRGENTENASQFNINRLISFVVIIIIKLGSAMFILNFFLTWQIHESIWYLPSEIKMSLNGNKVIISLEEFSNRRALGKNVLTHILGFLICAQKWLTFCMWPNIIAYVNIWKFLEAASSSLSLKK